MRPPTRSARSSISRSSRCRRFRSAMLKSASKPGKGLGRRRQRSGRCHVRGILRRVCPATPHPSRRFRGIALMNRAVVHLLDRTKRESEASGLGGMRIGARRPGLGQQSSRRTSGHQHGRLDVRLSEASSRRMDVAADKLMKGDVDALIATVYNRPHESIATRARRRRAIGGDQRAEVDRLRIHYPLLRRTLLPRGTLPGSGPPAAYRRGRSPARVVAQTSTRNSCMSYPRAP
jgi:hypothetical protein